MDICEKINAAIYCDDFFRCSQNILEFSESALKEKNRARIVMMFYEKLRQYALLDIIYDNKNYLIYEGKNAISKYMLFALPVQSTPVKSLHNIQKFAKCLLSDFTLLDGECIKPDMLSDIMKYLDSQYDFSRKVFSDRTAIFSVLDVSHSIYNGQCLVLKNEKEITQHFFLYRMSHKGMGAKTPEGVLFHELGHAIHARYAGGVDTIPENVLKYLKELCFPEFDSLTLEEQTEVFADVLSVGLMYESPFSQYDGFDYMAHEHKKAFKEMVESILESL